MYWSPCSDFTFVLLFHCCNRAANNVAADLMVSNGAGGVVDAGRGVQRWRISAATIANVQCCCASVFHTGMLFGCGSCCYVVRVSWRPTASRS